MRLTCCTPLGLVDILPHHQQDWHGLGGLHKLDHGISSFYAQIILTRINLYTHRHTGYVLWRCPFSLLASEVTLLPPPTKVQVGWQKIWVCCPRSCVRFPTPALPEQRLSPRISPFRLYKTGIPSFKKRKEKRIKQTFCHQVGPPMINPPLFSSHTLTHELAITQFDTYLNYTLWLLNRICDDLIEIIFA